MKRAAILVILLALVGTVAAAEKVSVQRGEELFNSTQLGTNGKSCATCHPKGKKLKGAAGYEEAELISLINRCISNPLEGKPLPADSPQMKSLVLYLRTFGRH